MGNWSDNNSVTISSMQALLLAHAGHDHVEATTSWTDSLTQPLTLWLVLIIGLGLIVILSQLVLKWKTSTTLLLVSTFLIVFSIFSYQNPGGYTVLAIAGGFGLVLFLSLLSLTKSS